MPSTEIFDMMFMKLELCFDRMNLYANNNRMVELYHSFMVNKIFMKTDNLITELESNTLIMTWPSCYKSKYYWNDLLKIYYQIINILLSNNKKVILACQSDDDIEKDLKNINYSLYNIKNTYQDNIFLYKTEYDDIWVRDYGPQQLMKNIKNEYIFHKFKYNGYGKKYAYNKDILFAESIVNFYQNLVNKDIKDHKKIKLLALCEDLAIEGGNIINDGRCLIMNKNPLKMHNSLSWSKIYSILVKSFKRNNIEQYYTIDVDGLIGDDTDGHIDNLVRINNDKLLYMSIHDIHHPNYTRTKDLKIQLEEIINESNNFNELIPIEHNSDDIVRSKEGNILPFSYLNYIRVADVVIIPTNKKTSDEKKSLLKNIFLNSKIYFIECSALLNQFGSLHCCTMNIKL